MNKRNKICFLFGAGASAFSEPNENHPLPPLGNQLFKKMKERGYIPDNLTKDLHAPFEENFEEGMKELVNQEGENSKFYAPLYNRLARYICEFNPTQNNYYVQLLDLCHQTKLNSRVVFSTLNYDLLIEKSFKLRHQNWCWYYRFPCLNHTSLLKLHGSCNFIPDLPVMRNVQFQDCANDIQTSITAHHSSDKIKSWCTLQEQNNNGITPALSFYMEGKPVKICSQDIKQQQEHWKHALKESQILYIVGVAFNENDTHIWQTIAESGCEVRIVDPKPQSIINYFKKRGVNVAHYAGSFKDAIPKWKKDFKTKKKFTPW